MRIEAGGDEHHLRREARGTARVQPASTAARIRVAVAVGAQRAG